MFPAFNRGVTGAQRVLEGVFVALCPRLPPPECRQPVQSGRSILEDGSPPFSSRGRLSDVIETSHTKYLLVGDSVLPQEPTEVEHVQFHMSRSRSHTARLGGLQLCRHKLRCLGDTALTPNSCKQATECADGIGQSTGDFGVKATR